MANDFLEIREDGSVWTDAHDRKAGDLEAEPLAAIVERALQGEALRRLALRASNSCDLRCRICGPHDSSGWASDRLSLEKLARDRYRRRAGEKAPGLRRLSDRAASRLLEEPSIWKDLEELELGGGEPFQEPLAWKAAEVAVAARTSARLIATTNALELREDALAIAARFSEFRARASAEATGALYAYLRGRPFEHFEKGFDRLRSLPNASVAVACAVSAYNAFGSADLFLWAKARGIAEDDFEVELVEEPPFLALWALPAETRARAARRLREAGVSEATSADLFAQLSRDDRAEDETRIQLFQEFIEFTSDLDRLRGERLAHAAPDLLKLEEPGRGSPRRGGLVWPNRR